MNEQPETVSLGSSMGNAGTPPAPLPSPTSTPTDQESTVAPSDSEFAANPDYKAPVTPPDSEFSANPDYKAPPTEKPNSPLTMNAGDSALTDIGKGAGGIFSGIGEGLFSTAAGAADIVHAPDQARQFLHMLSGDNENAATAETIGYGGETLAEFLLGDAGLKALPMAQKLETAAKTMKVIEGSPRLVQALKVGTKILKLATLHGAEAGVVQGAQTAIRTPGDLEQKGEEGLKEGAETAAGATALGVPFEAVGAGLQKAGEVAGKVKNLAKIAAGAKGTDEVAEELSNRLKGAEVKRGTDFEAGIQKIQGDLAGQTMERQGSPVALAAQKSLANPVPEDDPLTKAAKDISGDKLDTNTKKLLQQAAMGGEPAPVAAGETAKPLILDAKGNPVQSKNDLNPPTIVPHPPYTIDSLIQIRQAVREAAAGYDYQDVNAYNLRKLNHAIDDTIGKMAENTKQPEVLSNYQALRNSYKIQLHAYDNPVIRNLRDGKINDAAKAFVGLKNPDSALPSAGKTDFNIQSLTNAIGSDGVKAFGKTVFQTILKDSQDNGNINPAKFMKAWNRITDSTKSSLFDVQSAQNGLDQLAKDAHSGAVLQHLSRLGVLGTAGTAIGATGGLHVIGMGIGALLGLTVAEGGGFAAGRDLLNRIADNPATWNMYETAGKTAAKSTGTIPKIAAMAGTNAINNNKQNALKSALGATQNQLSQ